MVQAAQLMLADLGYDPGPADGKLGNKTMQALRAFQKDRGLPQTQELTGQAVAQLRSAHAALANGDGTVDGANDVRIVASDAPTGPGFDCGAASTRTEIAICQSGELSAMDGRMAQLYAAAVAAASSASAERLRQAQRSFLRKRDACRGDQGCIEGAYQERFTALAGLPGTTADSPAANASDPAQRAAAEALTASPQPAAPAAGGTGVAELLTPSEGIEPLAFSFVEGVPVFRSGDFDKRLFPLVKIGAVPGLLERDECNLVPLLVKKEVQARLVKSLYCLHGQQADWAGADEFAAAVTRKQFYERYGKALRDLAPRLPLTVMFVDDVALGRYDESAAGFPLMGGFGFGEDKLTEWRKLDDASAINPSSGGTPQQVTPSARFDWPNPFLPIAAGDAQPFIAEVNSWPYAQRPGDKPETGKRMVRRATILRFAALDAEAMRLDIELERMSLYNLDMTEKLHDFAVETAVVPFVAGDIPSRLEVPSPAPIDEIYLALRAIEKDGASASEDTWRRLSNIVVTRDGRYHLENEGKVAFGENDARKPFFAEGSVGLADVNGDAFEKWAAAYAAGLPPDLEYVTNASYGQPKPGSKHLFPAGVGQQAPSGDLMAALAARGIQEDQVGLIEDFDQNFLFVLPNARSLYHLEVAGDLLVPVVGKGLKLRTRYQASPIETISAANGETALLTFLDPQSTQVEVDGSVIASRGYADVPHLDGGFTAGDKGTEQAPAAGNFSLTPDFVTLLVAARGIQVPQEALTGLVLGRWQQETEGDPLGGRFFVAGKRRPTEAEAAQLGAEFSAWARQRIPVLPVRVTVASEFDLVSNAGYVDWTAMSCLSSALTQEDTFRIAANQRAFAVDEQRRMMAERGEAGVTWKAEDAIRNLARSLEERATAYLRRVDEPCYGRDAASETPDLYLSVPSNLPAPPGATGRVQATAAFQVTAVRWTTQRPQYLDYLPEGLAALLAAPSPPEQGSHVLVETRLAEVAYRTADGAEMALPPKETFSLAALIDEFDRGVSSLENSPAETGEPYGFDMIGLQVGMSFARAEEIIRAHMNVGRVLNGSRAAGNLEPATSGKLFISADGMELVAIIDEPPAAQGRVLAAWRRIYKEPGVLVETDVIEGLRSKYGTPSTRTIEAGIRNYWSTPAGGDCASVFRHGGQRPALSGSWTEKGAAAKLLLPNGQPMPDAMLPMPMLSPLDPSHVPNSECGPAFTAEFIFDASRTVKAGYPTNDLDWIEQIISDVGPYMKAYAGSRPTLGKTTDGTAKPEKGTVKF